MILNSKFKVGLSLLVLSSTALGTSVLAKNTKVDQVEERKPALRMKFFKNAFRKAQQKRVEAPINILDAQKAKLKQVDESEKNLGAKAVLAEKDPYDVANDLKGFIRKLRIDDKFSIKNETDQKMNVRIKFEAKDKLGFYKNQDIELNPGEDYIYDKKNNIMLSGLKLLDNTSNKYLNPKFTKDGVLQMKIEDTQDKYFLHQHPEFDFMNFKIFTPAELNDPAITPKERQFREEFNGSVNFMEDIGPKEGVSFQQLKQQRADLYEKNNIRALRKKNPDLFDSTVNKIPLVTHKIWATADDNPKMPSPQYIKWLENSIEYNKPSEGWTHYWWVENKEKLPELTKLLENHPTIKLMELDKLDTSTFVTGDLYKEAIKKKQFGKATDIIRLELLRQMGGFYLDTDYELYQSLKPYAKAYNMVMGLEPMSVYLCNAFMGASPNHPVVNKSLEMIKRNFSDAAPNYIKREPNKGFRTIIETGPALVSFAFGLAAGQGDNVDIALPPQIIYPAAAAVYPKKQVVTPDGKIPATAFGAHYWNTAWMSKEFGSKG